MSAVAINTAPTPIAGAPGVAGASTGVGGAHGAQVTGLPAIFEAMLATLTQAEDAATAGAALPQAATGGKVTAGAAKATPDDSKSKTKTADATDSQAATATATGATVPDSAVALLVPAPTSATTQAATAAAAADASAGQTDSSGAKTPALPVAAALAQGADADAGKAKTAALAADSAALNATANAKIGAIPTPAPTPAAPQAAAAIAIPADASATAAQAQAPALDAAATTAAEAVIQAGAQASAQANAQAGAKSAPTLTPVDGKAAAPKVASRSDAPKAPTGPADATALFANSAGKNADALAPIASASGKAGAPDKDSQTAADTETDQPAVSQTPADPATSATTTPATLMAAAAVAVRGSPETVANLAAQIVKKLDARSTQFDVQLDPAGLGKVDVRVQIGADGKMSAAMSFDTPQAAAELRARSNELQQALAQSGFDVSGGMSFDVSTDRGQNGQAQNQQPETGAAFRGKAFQTALDTTADTPPATLFTRQRSSASGVDIRI